MKKKQMVGNTFSKAICNIRTISNRRNEVDRVTFLEFFNRSFSKDSIGEYDNPCPILFCHHTKYQQAYEQMFFPASWCRGLCLR
jgi:hypothetical protein